ncbi:hypothetical protein JTE90_016687 [Oedothorax gibbosus]|uniref:Uncharacterized protein n=1 Tax=Oedothorax gibbosus TaxID=931172 RepID=A0AAV6TDY7_9ARAC|nr:hypothetical protein JTE90_016687 [Oedothorax gibbosus]
MDYDKHIEHIQGIPILLHEAETMASHSGSCNLVQKDWEETLENLQVHQNHKARRVQYSKGYSGLNGAYNVRSVASSANTYKLVVLGSFYLDKPKEGDVHALNDWSFKTRNCPPLQRIGEAMRESDSKTLNDGARLFMESCTPAMCVHCQTYHKKFNMECDLNRNWCVTKLRVFNGDTIKNTFKSQLTHMLDTMGTFMAICQINIYSRTSYGDDKFKVGGLIKNIIIFQESAILPQQMSFATEEGDTLPAIEFAEQKEEEDIIHVQPRKNN